jgi:uncharacterized membrane protein (DUF4010 family)
MKLYGPRGMEITAFLGGLINSRKVVVELSARLRQVGPKLSPCVYRGIMLAIDAMVLRNGLIVLVLASPAVKGLTIPSVLMLLVSLVLWGRCPSSASSGEAPTLFLESPFQLSAALKFGLVFLGLNVIGALAQRNFGSASFYFVSAAGGLLSSASSIASAATLITQHEISAATGVNGIIQNGKPFPWPSFSKHHSSRWRETVLRSRTESACWSAKFISPSGCSTLGPSRRKPRNRNRLQQPYLPVL